MLQFLKSIFSDGEAEHLHQVPAGERVYAVGDVHGRRDLLAKLVEAIEQDDAEAGAAQTTVVMLGDLVDRGPESAGVVDLVRQWQRQRNVRVLGGNHEEMFLKSFTSAEMMRHFLRHGGRETVHSYGVDQSALSQAQSIEEMQQMIADAVPQADRDYIAGFEDMIRIGDYLFVHAGIDPAIDLAEQRVQDLRWIREPFLSFSEPHGLVVVHGHTISDEPEDRGNRIGIDTGAYASGRLTALVLEGAHRRYIEAVEGEDGKITAAPRPIAA